MEELSATIIADCVDEAIFQLLRAIDNEDLRIHYKASNDKMVDLPAEGLSELAGWYIGNDGWREMFSKKRILR
jgi:hypothetical protein